jgi:hypothetical protein
MEQHVMPTGCGHLTSPLSLGLTDHICQVQTTVRMPAGPLAHNLDRLNSRHQNSPQEGLQLADRGDAEDFDPFDQVASPGLPERHDHRGKPAC